MADAGIGCLSPVRVEVTSLDAARAAVARAAAVGRPLVLESPAGAAGWLGIGWWRNLTATLADEGGGAVETVLDCGHAPGLALEALRAGCPGVRVAAAPEVLAALSAIAAKRGGRVLPPRSASDQFAAGASDFT